MQAVHEIHAGIAGAPSGVARFYKYNRASRFSEPINAYDKDGNAIGTSVTLDANGGASDIYVAERADVRVESVAGSEIRTFSVEGDDASTTVENANFTGTSRVDGSQI